MTYRFSFILVASLFLAGCASTPAPQAAAPATPATQPSPQEQRAALTLDQIEPRPVLAAPATSKPSQTEPPIESIVEYGRAIDDLLQGRPFDAVEALNKAVQADPDSFALYLALGEAEIERSRGPSPQSFDAFEHAAALHPDDLRIHVLLARQYIVAGNDAAAMRHLRLALQTTDFRHNAPGSAAAQLLLGHVLQRQGYDRAALDQFLQVARRLSDPSFDVGLEPSIGLIDLDPRVLGLEIGRLYELRGQYADALTAYEPLAAADPANFPLQSSVVHMLLRLDRQDEATQKVADLVEGFRADTASMALLREVCQTVGYDREIDILRRLHRQNPDDRAILFTLADVLTTQNRRDDAGQLLHDAAAAHPTDQEIARRLFDFYLADNDTSSAAKLLVAALAAQPDYVREIDEMFFELIRPLRQNALRLATFQKLDTPPETRAAKLYLASRLAIQWQRDALAHSCIEEAVKFTPPFSPAFREQVDNIWTRPDLSEPQKIQTVADLAASAQSAGAPALAAEIRGLNLINQDNFPQAIDAFDQAIRLGGNSPDLQLTYAAALLKVGKNLQCEQTLWKLVTQRPHYDEAWNSLHGFYVNSDRQADALRVLQQWRQADPGSAGARLHQAVYNLSRQQFQTADEELSSLVEDHSDDSAVLQTIALIYQRLNHIDAFMAKLAAQHERQPTNLTLVASMVSIDAQLHRLDDASRLLDEAYKAVSNDADLLYQLAALYHQIGQMHMWEQMLAQVLKIDPKNVAANNDLGYAWADAGKNLDTAEQMIRLAVTAEPDNQAFLDSLGWVLYKRGRFAEAQHYFEQAIGPSDLPDPAILDHYADDLYRQHHTVPAQQQWQRSLLRLQNRVPENDEDIQLREQIQRKLAAAARGLPADVAPLAP